MRLYFGPRNRYFFDDEQGFFLFRVHEEFLNWFNATNIKKVYSLAFGSGDVYYICFQTTTLKKQHYYYWSTNAPDPYPKFKSWIFDEGLSHVAEQTSVSFGTNGSFFATSNQGHRWHNLPEAAQDYYQKFTSSTLFARSRVHGVDIGIDDTFLGIRIDQAWFWELGSSYPRCEETVMNSGRIKGAKWVSINPFARDQHFAVFEDGTIDMSLPKEWSVDIAHALQQARKPPANRTSSMYGGVSSTEVSGVSDPFAQYLNAGNQDAARRRFNEHFSRYLGSQHSINSPPPSYTQVQTPSSPTGFDSSGAIHLGHTAYDNFNNITNAFGQGDTSSNGINQSVDFLNGVMTQGGSGASGQVGNFAGQFAQQALNSGLLAGQMGVGLAGACTVM